ncbi:MAG: FixH family protein [Fimbriimonadaceae bacterium]|nr:FixH family protein [Alphaproteobacteria bacterium]
MATIKDTSGQFTGKHMLFLVVGFFVIIFLMNLVLAYFALGSWPGLLVRNGYDASQSYNEQIEQARIQNAYGWQSKLELDSDAAILRITGTSGNPVRGLMVTAAAARPTNESEDRILEVTENPDGSYQGSAPLSAGSWVISIRAENSAASQVYRRTFRILVQP